MTSKCGSRETQPRATPSYGRSSLTAEFGSSAATRGLDLQISVVLESDLGHSWNMSGDDQESRPEPWLNDWDTMGLWEYQCGH